MKPIVLYVCTMIAVITTAYADLLTGHVRLGDFDQTHQVFSFTKGVITLAPHSKVPITADIFLDLPHGLGTNNPQLDRSFTGRGALLDLGLTPLKAKIKIPKLGLKAALKPKELISGHTYLVRLGAGDSYGQLRVLKFDIERALLDFTWCKAVQTVHDEAIFDLAVCQGSV